MNDTFAFVTTANHAICLLTDLIQGTQRQGQAVSVQRGAAQTSTGGAPVVEVVSRVVQACS